MSKTGAHYRPVLERREQKGLQGPETPVASASDMDAI